MGSELILKCVTMEIKLTIKDVYRTVLALSQVGIAQQAQYLVLIFVCLYAEMELKS